MSLMWDGKRWRSFVSEGNGLAKPKPPPASMMLFLKRLACAAWETGWLEIEPLPGMFEALGPTPVTETETHKKLEWNMNVS